MRQFVLTGLAILSCCMMSSPAWSGEVSFSRDVLPLLSDRCFHCHGPDEANREAELRLDQELAAKADRGGYAAIVPGAAEASELWRRISTTDQAQLMPPPDSHRKPLSEAEQRAIHTWIQEGAKWGGHWSFERPVQADPPKQASHPVDAFVRDRLAQQGLKPSPAAEPHSQLRRLSFALTGLAPDRALLESFVANPSQDAWREAVEQLLQSPQHAERLAMWWLDAARYSDSDGYQIDATRENWPWRDWVIQAFQRNMPFDQFTIEQFAGDLLPEATTEQILATCFHRNHMTNGEGGRDPEESRVDYVIDRVNTMGTVWLGLTLGCVQCHSHKFDPISQHEYYSLAAFFNSIDEDGRAGKGAKPNLKVTSPYVKSQVDSFKLFVADCASEEAAAREQAERRFASWLSRQLERPQPSYQVWQAPLPARISSAEGTQFKLESDSTIQTSGPDLLHDDYRIEIEVPDGLSRISGWRIEIFPHASHHQQMFTRFGNGDFLLTSVRFLVRRAGRPSEVEIELAGAVADYEAKKDRKSVWDRRYANIAETLNDDARDGWTTEGANQVETHVGVYALQQALDVEPGDHVIVMLRQRSTQGHANIGRFRISLTSELGEAVRRTDGRSPLLELYESAANSTDELDPQLKQRLLQQYLLSDDVYQRVKRRHDLARKQLKSLEQQATPRTVMVLQQRDTPRETHVLLRGVWDAHGERVQPGVLPSVLNWPAEQTRTRLDLARWLVDRNNPLTARVVVNQLWQIMFGQGLVRTPEDFGLQGQLPSHPELLDWLAVELMEHDWDLRHILKLIATSETFRQSSLIRPELLAADPENRWLARAPRYRLPAWMLRDNALHVSGLLNRELGGPPVFPYQPQGVWAEITMGRFHYEPSVGPPQYRRTIYAFWRRSSAPTFLFDSAQRRVCETGVRRTNTPLQALTLMNDTTMREAARALADERVGKPINQEIQQLGMIVLSRPFEPADASDLTRVFERARDYFQDHPQDAERWTTVGQRPAVRRDRSVETAAWMTVANLVLNLDEAISSE